MMNKRAFMSAAVLGLLAVPAPLRAETEAAAAAGNDTVGLSIVVAKGGG